MTTTIEAGVLAGAMKSAAAMTESRNTIPIMANVRLHAAKNKLEVVTSDLDTEYRQIIPCGGTGLKCTVDAKRFAALAGAAGRDATLSMDIVDAQLVIKSGRSKWTLPTLPFDDFPAIPGNANADGLTVDGDILANAIGRVSWAISTETTRYYLNGIYFSASDDGEKTVMVATDGTALCLTEIAAPCSGQPVIFGTKFVNALANAADGCEGNVSLSWDDRKITATIGDVTLTSKSIDGSFPDYKRVIPSLVDAPVLFDPEIALGALKRINVTGDTLTKRIALECGTDIISLSAATSAGGSAVDEVPANCAPMDRFGINSGYLASALNAIGGDTIEMHSAYTDAPKLFRRAIDDGTLAVVTWMRI